MGEKLLLLKKKDKKHLKDTGENSPEDITKTASRSNLTKRLGIASSSVGRSKTESPPSENNKKFQKRKRVRKSPNEMMTAEQFIFSENSGSDESSSSDEPKFILKRFEIRRNKTNGINETGDSAAVSIPSDEDITDSDKEREFSRKYRRGSKHNIMGKDINSRQESDTRTNLASSNGYTESEKSPLKLRLKKKEIVHFSEEDLECFCDDFSHNMVHVHGKNMGQIPYLVEAKNLNLEDFAQK